MPEMTQMHLWRNFVKTISLSYARTPDGPSISLNHRLADKSFLMKCLFFGVQLATDFCDKTGIRNNEYVFNINYKSSRRIKSGNDQIDLTLWQITMKVGIGN